MTAMESSLCRMGELISLSAVGGTLKKAVFSKPDDPTVTRVELTLRRIGGKVMAQTETRKTDNKAVHENRCIAHAICTENDTALLCNPKGLRQSL